MQENEGQQDSREFAETTRAAVRPQSFIAHIPAVVRGRLARRGSTPHWAVRYTVAIACPTAATVLTLLAHAVLKHNPFALFYAAVMLSAWYGGLGPGLLATACSVLTIDTFLLPSFTSGMPGSKELIQIGIFGGVALLISSLNAMRKRAIAERDGLIALEQSAREEAERVAQDNARLYRDAQDANRLKDEFLAVVSHELRTPLNAILGWSQLLHKGELDEPSMVQGMSAIERNARSQARIIDDVLDVSRIIQGKLRLDVKPTRLRPIIEEALDVVRPAAEAKRIHLVADLDEAGGAVVSGDSERLRQVAWNLLSNAVKFTPDGGRVELTLTQSDGHIVLRVRDSGKGIDPRFLPHVFERFRQADSSSTRAHGGLGLGLAIVRHLVELHGGSVQAESEGEGKGATFTVRLPTEHRPQPLRAPQAPASESAAHPELAGLRVLLVEDEPDARELFANMLEMCGAEVMAVGSARDALAAFRLRRPDVLLSDIGMPGEDGYALIREVRALEGPQQARRTPAMAITAFAGAEDRKRALRAGYQMHVPKPIGSTQFAAAVAALTREAAPAAR